MFFVTCLRRELRRRMRQTVFITLGLALGIGLDITVTAAAAGVTHDSVVTYRAQHAAVMARGRLSIKPGTRGGTLA